MKCPFCNSKDTIVKDSRHNNEYTQVRRRRQCVDCKERYTTIERLQVNSLFVIKKSGIKKAFDREKIYRSIKTAVRKRNITEETIQGITDKIVKSLELGNLKEISTIQIGSLIMGYLKDLDQVSYIRFASVYKDFTSLTDFAYLIKTISIKKKKIYTDNITS